MNEQEPMWPPSGDAMGTSAWDDKSMSAGYDGMLTLDDIMRDDVLEYVDSVCKAFLTCADRQSRSRAHSYLHYHSL